MGEHSADHKSELDEMLQPGNILKVYYGENNINNHIRHIRAIVDKHQIAYCVWQKKRGYYHYCIASRDDFEYMYNKGKLRKYKSTKTETEHNE